MSLDQTIKERIEKIESIISEYLPKPDGYAAEVMEAMEYSFLAGGKRLRPMIMMETHIMCGGDGRIIAPFMAALEMIHTYSLVHDDLPAMDNDELRRGKPTTWKKYGDGMAVLAGDGLLNYSVETAVYSFDLAESAEDYLRIAQALKILYYHSGIYGMIGGQCADLVCEAKSDVTEEELLYIHENKTAALLRAAFTIGAVLAGADDETVIALDRVGVCVGLAFQIQDDILDVTSTDEELGKPVGSDSKNEKSTYVSLYGLEKAKEEVNKLSNEAMDILASMKTRNDFLEELVKWLIDRKH